MDKVNEVVECLKNGGVVICPTDTVYGFLADSTNKKAVSKIYQIKGRDKVKPLPIFVASIAMVKTLAKINKKQLQILKKYWPGRYTFILERKEGKELFGVAPETIAVRIPKHAFLQKVLKKMKCPLAQTSVNVSGQDPLNSARDIEKIFGKSHKVAMIVDGGRIRKIKSSKIIDITNNKNNIIRK
jgi:L-threonylcarbamoyladenylate synthase